MANHIFNTYKVKLDGNTVIQSDSDGAFKIYNGDDDTLQADVIAMSNNIVTNSTNLDTEESTRLAADESLSTDVATEETTRLAADESLSTDVATNSTNVGTNSSNIATNSSNIATNSSNIAGNSSSISANSVAIQTNSTNVSTEESTRLSADESLESLINTNDTFATGVSLSASDQYKTVSWSDAGKSWGAGTPKAMGTLRSATDGAAILAVQTSGCDATSATFVFSDDMPDGTYTLDVFAAV